ncbi:SIMPL domain-containing protein [Beijerinckia indica]|uniref:DUF541 domain-containing protein n=1 Tax=Beijerinckia indica subsp. indica (strain ATCC 9039 / DSM 1715 / NCIMB 8712) TaxID=395963 RepID=B2IGZ6_BEII9|nr:SIMPL domain-containing protein [Beijerinckia indica]ACB94410.1 protein of unknown function DUF541 [Beijerinckia indica subsp. indica ATCC 9039]
MIEKSALSLSFVLTIFSCLTFGSAAGVRAQGLSVPLRDSVPAITVTGQASTEIVPDTALISLGVETEMPRASDASAENARSVQTLIDTLRGQGVESKDIRTLQVSLVPVYEDSHDPAGELKKRVLRGYRARNEFVLRVSPLALAGQLAGSLFDKGLNVIDGIDFQLADKSKVLDKLRGEAASDALAQAKSFAAPLGLQPGRVLVIQPQGPVGFPIPMVRAQKAVFAQADHPPVLPVEPGTQKVQVETQVTFELTPAKP